MGDGSQLGHRSTLYTGQAVPAGERWHGSPGRRTERGLRQGRADALPSWRRGWFATSQLISTIGLGRILLGQAVIALVVLANPNVAALLETQALAFTDWVFYADAIVYAGSGRLRWHDRSVAPHHDRAAGAPTRREAGHGVSAVRAAARGGAGGVEDDQQAHAAGIVRRQLVRRELRAGHRVQAAAGPADRLEPGHGVQARQPVPFDDRHRHDDRRRGVVHEHRLLGDVVQGQPGGDRRTQLPGQRRALPGRGQDRGQLPARDQGHGPHRRTGAPRRGPARVTAVRDPPLGPAGRPSRGAFRTVRTSVGTWRPRTGTTCARWPS